MIRLATWVPGLGTVKTGRLWCAHPCQHYCALNLQFIDTGNDPSTGTFYLDLFPKFLSTHILRLWMTKFENILQKAWEFEMVSTIRGTSSTQYFRFRLHCIALIIRNQPPIIKNFPYHHNRRKKKHQTPTGNLPLSMEKMQHPSAARSSSPLMRSSSSTTRFSCWSASHMYMHTHNPA